MLSVDVKKKKISLFFHFLVPSLSHFPLYSCLLFLQTGLTYLELSGDVDLNGTLPDGEGRLLNSASRWEKVGSEKHYLE